MEDKKGLAAPCGLYCGACSAYVARKRGDVARLQELGSRFSRYLGQEIEVKDLECDGCLSSDVLALYCRNCGIRECARDKALIHCAECAEFPCQRLIDFNNDGIRHHGEVLDNIQRQRVIGVAAWERGQAERWRCPTCGCATDWYARRCPDCDTALPGQF